MNRTVNIFALTALLWSAAQMPTAHASQQCLGAPAANGVEQHFANLQLRQQVHQVDQSVLQTWQAIPHDQRDVAALQQELGDDPVALYRWVRDNTYWLPYDGALRGARGTLLDRSGSSLDRALLLAELLRAAGENVRLAQAPLTAEQQQQLQEYWLQQSRPQPQLAPAPTQQQFETWSAELNRPVTNLQQQVTRQRDQAQAYLDTIAEAVDQQVAGLAELTQVKSVAAPQVQHHWWVQWQGSEGWRDLDPANREQVFGKPWLALNASQIATVAVEQLDAADQHRLRVMIVAEQLQAGKLHEHIALDHTFAATELTQQQLKISVTPVSFPTVNELIDGSISAQQAERQLLLQQQWLPAIQLGKDSIIQKAITADGSIEDPLTGQVSSATAAAVSSAIAELSTMDAPQENDHPAELSAVYVRYEITAPGREKQQYQRPLMNVLSAAEREQLANVPEFNTQRYQQRGAQLLSDVVLVAQNNHSNAAENTAQRMRDILVHRTEIQGLASVLDGGSVDLVESIVASASMRNSVLDLLTFYRFLVSPYSHQVVLTELNLFSYVQQADYRERLTSAEGFDIISNSVTAFVADDAQRAHVQFAQGVVDTFLEAELIAPEPSLAKLNNTASQYASALARNEPWQTISTAAELSKLAWLDDSALKFELERQLSAGNIIVAPQHLGNEEQPSWWMYDPTRAQLLGYDRHARGGVLVETLLDLMGAFESASGAVEMVHTVIGCTLNYSNYDPVCCISVEAAKSFGGDFVKGSALSRAKARWMQLFPDADKAMMFFFEEAVSARIGDVVDPIVEGLGNYGMNTQCKV